MENNLLTQHSKQNIINKPHSNNQPVNTNKEEYSTTNQDFFSSFVYQDHVTRQKCEYSKLKNWKKVKTLGDESSDEWVIMSDQIKTLKAIKQIRNKQLIQGCKMRNIHHKNGRNQSNISFESLRNMRKAIRGQVLSLNHDYLREYLYHHQPFNKMVSDINRCSNQGVVNELKIKDLQKRITRCIEQRRSIKKNLITDEQQKKRKNGISKPLKQIYENEIDQKFEGIWAEVKKSIGTKIRMEGEFNLYHLKSKPKLHY